MERYLETDFDGRTFTIRVQGALDFSWHQVFRQCYEAAPAEVGRYVVDLRDSQRLDSPALGMLLLLRGHAGGADQVSLLVGESPCRETLQNANFGLLFQLV